MNTNLNCAFFGNAKGRGKNLPLFSMLLSIKDGKWRKEIEHLRSLAEECEQKAVKNALPAFMISATTSNGGHSKNDIKSHTGLLQIDVDNLESQKAAEELREKLRSDPHVLSAWLSPRARGVKAILRINSSLDDHLEAFKSAEKRFKESHGVTIDPSCKDPCRLCYVSYDPELWINELALSPVAFTNGCAHGGKEKGGDGSSTELPTPSCTLQTTSYTLQSRAIFKDYPDIEPFYRNLVCARYSNIQPGHRNDALCEMIPLLFSAVHPTFILPFAAAFYLDNKAIFGDPLERHLKETRSLLRGCEKSYSLKRLSEQERLAYDSLEDREKCGFRVLHSLAACEAEDCPPPFFFMSREKLAVRLNCLESVALSVFKLFIRRGIIQQVEKGQRREKGIVARASRYKWMLPSLEVVVDPDASPSRSTVL